MIYGQYELVVMPGESKLLKAAGLASRVVQLVRFGMEKPIDVAVSHGSRALVLACRVLNIPSVTMYDYEFVSTGLFNRLSTKVMLPDGLPDDRLRVLGLSEKKVLKYSGFKEEVYVTDFTPDGRILTDLDLDVEFSRIVTILNWGISITLLTLSRFLVDRVQLSFLRRGYGIKKAIIVGAGPEGIRIAKRLRSHVWMAYRPDGFLDDDVGLHGKEVEGLRVLGGTDQISEVTRKEGVDEVIVALPSHSREQVEDIVAQCHREGLRFKIMPDLFEILSGQVKVGSINGVPVLDVEDIYLGHWDRFIKRGIDLIGAIVTLIMISPIWLPAALLIKIFSRGPVLFRQKRVGEHGMHFTYFKFRTMRVGDDSEERKNRYADLITGVVFAGKIVSEDRITRFGKFLRNSSIDELPQLINVIKGEMSLVGPRPRFPTK